MHQQNFGQVAALSGVPLQLDHTRHLRLMPDPTTIKLSKEITLCYCQLPPHRLLFSNRYASVSTVNNEKLMIKSDVFKQ